MAVKQKICLLGATGSIGTSTLDLIEQHPERFQLYAAAAHTNVVKMAAICRRFKPQRVVMGTQQARDELVALCSDLPIQFEWGVESLCDIASAPEVDQVMAAILGFAGLKPTLAAIRAKKRVLLANKESLVTAGKLFMDEVEKHQVTLMPIDSEHNAIYQCLPQNSKGVLKQDVHKIVLTASGGPFREWSIDDMISVTPEQACKHPNWSMGQKISVDSATLMNKGLELIEACWLFGVTPSDVQVVIQPQSIIHSMVSYKDGSVIAQMGNSDMKIPIAYGMSWPERLTTAVPPLDFIGVGQLDFSEPDVTRFPNLKLASDAWYLGGTAMAYLNAANEVAVAAFLDKKIGFLDIADVNRYVLDSLEVTPTDELEQVFAADAKAREFAGLYVHKRFL